MIPGLIAHFNGTATVPTNPNLVRTEKDPAIVYLSDPCEMYIKLCSEYSQKK
ncbi:hypothetical protein HI914_07480 [Erysiphe necator]|nr:hypothetical protein HI914_07480 [Erysiphe necator]